MPTPLRAAFLVGASVALAIGGSRAMGDWPNFRGPHHDGISLDRGLKTTWNTAIPLVWQRPLGSAFSSFACVGNSVYTCGMAGERQTLVCLDADTGGIRWQRPFEKAYRDSNGDGTRATPSVDDGRVYILGAEGRLLCADARDGREIWSTRFHNKPMWGYSGSVLIEGELAIASGGGEDGALAAFDKRTGQAVWTCGDDPAGYATPYPFTFEGRRYVVGFMGNAAIIAGVKTGRLVWRMPWKTNWQVNAASPIFHDGYLFLTSGYQTGCALLKLRMDGDTIAAETVWKSKVLQNKFQSCILHDGKLYGSDQKAFKCVDFLTGREHWRKNRVKHGTLILADDYLYLLTQKGELQIGQASPEDFLPVTKAEILGGRCWTVSVLHRGRLYARNLERAVCFDLSP